MVKKGIGNAINEEYSKIVDNLYAELGGNKFRIYEAAIEIFNVLPSALQRCLISYDEQERQLIFDTLREMKVNAKLKKRAKQA